MAKSVVAFSLEEFDPTYTRVLVGNANFTNVNFTDLGTLEVITGDANFENSQVENLGSLNTIGGSADFRESQVESLGNLITIGGGAFFNYSQVKDLGKLTTIVGFANFREIQVESLGNLTTINGNVSLFKSQVEDLGNLTTIGGDAYFNDSKVESLGNLTTIRGNADFGDSEVKNLGNLTMIGGYANFRSSQIENLGNLTTIEGNAYFGERTDLEAEWEKISNKDNFKTGGQPLSKTPAPKKDRVYGSKKNKPESSKDTKSAEKIEFNEKTLETIKNKVAEHNEKNPKKKVTLASAKAVVRRGMGAYSSTHRPTISGGKPNSRVAWGLARLNAFLYKIINGKSKSGKYSQDNDLIEELGYKVQKYADGGQVEKMKNLFLQNGFTEDELQVIVEENTNYFNQIEFYDNETLIVYRALELPRKLADKFIKLNKKEIGEGIGEYWTFNKNLQNAIWGDGQYEEETYLIQCKGHLDISDIDWEMMKYAYDDDIYHFSQESEIRGVNGGNSIKVVECEEVYSNGGDIQAYEDAMGISQFDEGGETKPKKVYVSIKLQSKTEYVRNEDGLWGGDRFKTFEEKTFEELKKHQLVGIRGVSLSPNNVGDWFSYKDCLVVMNYDEFVKLNDATKVKYDDPYQLMANDLKIFNRLYGNSEYTDEREKKITRRENLKKIIEKIPFYFDKAKYEYYYDDAQKRDELQRYYYILGNYRDNFIRWIIDNEYIINSPNDLTERLIEFAHLPNSESGIDNYRNFNLEKYVLSAEDIFPIVMKGLIKAGSTYTDEAEVIINNKLLNLPNKTQLFFKKEDFENSNLQDLIDKYELEKTYRVYSIKSQYIKKYQDKLWVSRTKRDIAKWELGKEQLEVKKELVLNDLQKLFFDKSLDKINKILDEKYPSTYYFEWEGEETKYFRWNEVIEVQFLLNKFFEITLRDWKSVFKTKKANEIYSMSFYAIYDSIELFLRQFIEQNRDYLENINKYHNENGDYLWLYDIERAVLGVVSLTWDEENGISHDELAKKYFQMIGGELTTYYKQDEIVMPSIYINGGKADEPTEFWGTEAGGVLVYCSTTQRYLILLRSEWVLEPNTWGIISGKLDDEENIKEAVLREAEEETGHKLGRLIPSYIFERPKFKFHNFISIVDEEFIPELNWENTDYKWVKINEMPENLHFGLKLLLEKGDIPKLVANNVSVEKYADGGLIAPNGKQSGLYFTEIYNLVRTKEFKEWFGDWEEAYRTKNYDGVSKIIDENGEPLICVHNTPNEFYEFDEYEIGRNTDAGYYGKGFYFTPNVGQSRYGEIELNCFLNIKNPYFKQSSYRNYELNSDELKNQGYDGVVVYPSWIDTFNFENGVDGCEEVVAYYSEQIKLGDGRNTTFDNYNSNIRFMAGGLPKKRRRKKGA